MLLLSYVALALLRFGESGFSAFRGVSEAGLSFGGRELCVCVCLCLYVQRVQVSWFFSIWMPCYIDEGVPCSSRGGAFVDWRLYEQCVFWDDYCLRSRYQPRTLCPAFKHVATALFAVV